MTLKMTRILQGILFVLSAIIVVFLLRGTTRNTAMNYCKYYDDSVGQKPVFSHELLDSQLARLEKVPYYKLPQDYIDKSESENQKNRLQFLNYFQVEGMQVFDFLVGHFRVADFMSKDTFYTLNTASLPLGISQYWLCDTAVLHRFLDLVLWMRSKGYNDSALFVKNGHRHPAYNAFKGGVPQSYHMQGSAIDIQVGDINRNGIANAADKKIILDILEQKIIGNTGGLGLYPKSDVVHFDTRGFRARWNSH
jgi:hypothetical protein